MDVEALYPSIEIERTSVALGEMMEETEVEYENIDYETAARFIASNTAESTITKWGMADIIPRRRFSKGVRPGPTTAELGRKRKYNEKGEELQGETKWYFRRKTLSKAEKKHILGKVVEI